MASRLARVVLVRARTSDPLDRRAMERVDGTALHFEHRRERSKHVAAFVLIPRTHARCHFYSQRFTSRGNQLDHRPMVPCMFDARELAGKEAREDASKPLRELVQAIE